VRLSGRGGEGYLLSRPRLEYPALARDSRPEGTVVNEAVISREGRIRPETVRVLSGHPILARAASTAILEWEYQPYLLGGVPIEVITTITVRYTMGGGL
jgi:protein TonB